LSGERVALGRCAWGLLVLCGSLPHSAYAQSGSTAAIAGVVRDTTGAVLPGVTVEAASPTPRLDVYNLLNSDAVNSMITRYGQTWLRPQEVFGARMVKLGVQVDF
jgi:hypothetical protein